MGARSLADDESYYRILEFLDKSAENRTISTEDLRKFRETIRDNKYVAVYVRALKMKMEKLNDIDDFIRAIDKNSLLDLEDRVDHTVRDVMECSFGSAYQVDPIKIIHNLIRDALAREGKICDFRDSVNPDTKMGRCESMDHYETVGDNISLTPEQEKEFQIIAERDGEDAAKDHFIDLFNPVQKLNLTLYQDDDTSKFNDHHAEYVCDACMQRISEDGDCEVACDME